MATACSASSSRATQAEHGREQGPRQGPGRSPRRCAAAARRAQLVAARGHRLDQRRGRLRPAARWASSVRKQVPSTACTARRPGHRPAPPRPRPSAPGARTPTRAAARPRRAHRGHDRTVSFSRTANRSQSGSAGPARWASSTTTTSGARSARRPAAPGPGPSRAPPGPACCPPASAAAAEPGARSSAAGPSSAASAPGVGGGVGPEPAQQAGQRGQRASSGIERSSGPHDAISTVSPARAPPAQARSSVGLARSPTSPSTTTTSYGVAGPRATASRRPVRHPADQNGTAGADAAGRPGQLAPQDRGVQRGRLGRGVGAQLVGHPLAGAGVQGQRPGSVRPSRGPGAAAAAPPRRTGRVRPPRAVSAAAIQS